MEKQNNIPRLRFPGFEGEWEQHKLGDAAIFINGRAYSQDELLDSGKYKVLRVGNFYTNNSWYYSDMELDEKYYAKKGDLLYTWSATFGPHIWDGDKVIFHYHIWKVELSEYLEKYFAVQLLEQDKENILSNKNGSTMVHITKAGMEEKSVLIPSDMSEQLKIGQYLNAIDTLITLNQRKLDQMKEYKKGMLQKMFPKDGETVPEIRFSGFEGDWEPCSLENVVSIMGGNAWKSSDYKLGGKFLVITIANVSGDININENVGNYIDCDDHSVFVLHKNDILVSLTGNVGRVSKMTGIPAVLNQRVAKIIPKTDSIISDFLFHIMHNSKFEKAMIECGQGAAQKNISNKDILCYDFLMPLDKKEQMAIANYFNNLDELITLHQYKLEQMKEYKKGLLQQMFV